MQSFKDVLNWKCSLIARHLAVFSVFGLPDDSNRNLKFMSRRIHDIWQLAE